jgi:hypothetical protein
MDEIAEIVRLLERDGADCVVHYGSSRTDPEGANDIDVVAIYEGNGDHENFQLGPFDVLRLSSERFEYFLRVLDPVYATEPCLTGTCIAGDEEILAAAVEDIEASEPSQRAVNHAVRRSMAALQDCLKALGNADVDYVAGRLPFAVSYWLFASWYVAGNDPALLSTVRDRTGETDVVDTVFDLQSESNSQEVSRDTVSTVLQRWQRFLLQNRFDCPGGGSSPSQ